MAIMLLHMVPSVRVLIQRFWQRLERGRLLAACGVQSPLWGRPRWAGVVPGPAFALLSRLRKAGGNEFRFPSGLEPAVQTPTCLPEPAAGIAGSGEGLGFLGSVLWMAAPKKRRSIEVNRCRRRNPHKLIPVKRNIDVCPECGNLKLKHVLCAYCYAKVKAETQQIRKEIGKMEGGPFNAPTVETVVLYDGEKPTGKDEGKRIIERARKRPSWFIQN